MIHYFTLALSGMSLIVGLISLRMVYKVPSFAAVDLHTVLHHQAQNLARSHPNGKVPTKQLQHEAATLTAQLKGWAELHKIILFEKSMVLGGRLPDYTKHFMSNPE